MCITIGFFDDCKFYISKCVELGVAIVQRARSHATAHNKYLLVTLIQQNPSGLNLLNMLPTMSNMTIATERPNIYWLLAAECASLSQNWTAHWTLRSVKSHHRCLPHFDGPTGKTILIT